SYSKLLPESPQRVNLFTCPSGNVTCQISPGSTGVFNVKIQRVSSNQDMELMTPPGTPSIFLTSCVDVSMTIKRETPPSLTEKISVFSCGDNSMASISHLSSL